MSRVAINVLFYFFLSYSFLSYTCTSFNISKSRANLITKSYDWYAGHGLLIVNKRNVSKIAITNSENKVRWISRFGSVTFNQFAREFPVGGINEAGLVVEALMLGATTFPPYDSRPAINYMQWIQYQLDKYSTINEVLTHINDIRIEKDMVDFVRVHFLICDTTASCMVVEFIDGKVVYYKDNNLPLVVLTNNSYQKAIGSLKQYNGFGGDLPIPTGTKSFVRFIKASHAVSNFTSVSSIAKEVSYAFKTLKDVSMGNFTKWNIVYNNIFKQLYFKTFGFTKAVTFVDIKKLNFNCEKSVEVMDLRGDITGSILRKFIPYKESFNKRSIVLTLEKLNVVLPLDLIKLLIKYPETTKCIN